MLQDLFNAVVLLLMLEGAAFALCPSCMRRAARLLRELPDEMLRNVGLGTLAAGGLLLYFFGAG